MTKLFTVAFLALILITCGQKETIDKDKERINKVCDSYMNMFATGKTDEAMELLKQNTVMTPSTVDTLKVTLANQMNDFFPAYGKMISAEFVLEQKIKDFIAKRFYILRFDKYYLKFDFVLYKGNNGWTITNFNYNEDLIEVLY
jgi:hypothetical protein